MKEKDLKNNYSKVCCVLYHKVDLKRLVAFCQKHTFKFYYIRHNDFDENMNEKKQHWHFVIESDSKHRFNIKSLLSDTLGVNLFNKLDSVDKYLRYMLHIDYIDKKHYDLHRIVSNVDKQIINDLINKACLSQQEINYNNFQLIINMIINHELMTYQDVLRFCFDNNIKYITTWSFTILNLLGRGVR